MDQLQNLNATVRAKKWLYWRGDSGKLEIVCMYFDEFNAYK